MTTVRPLVVASCFALVSCKPSLTDGARVATVACEVAGAVVQDRAIVATCQGLDALAKLGAALTAAGQQSGDVTVTVRQQGGAETTVTIPAESIATVVAAVDAARARVAP